MPVDSLGNACLYALVTASLASSAKSYRVFGGQFHLIAFDIQRHVRVRATKRLPQCAAE